MSLISYTHDQDSIILRVKILDSSVSTGAGLTGLDNTSSGLIISTIADNEATAVAYTVAGSLIETIATLGTYAAPTATKCRFKEVDATNHKGVYEIQLADARFAVASAKYLLVSISGATNAAECDALIPLTQVDPYSTAFNLSLAKTTNITGFNDLSAAQVNAECDTALTDYGANTTTPPTAAAIRTEIDSNSTQLAAIVADTGTDGVVVAAASKTGYRLSATGVDDILDEAITEPSGMFAWGSATLRNIIATLGTLMRNKVTSDSDSVDVRDDADAATLWSYSSTDDGSTFTSGEGT